jgi:hypothetical protein
MCRSPSASLHAMEGSVWPELQAASSRLLSGALERVLQRLDDAEDVRAFIDAHSFSFANYAGPDGEHMLEWMQLYHEYCEIVENAIQSELQVLGCSEEALLEHAVHSEDELGNELISRLLAKTEYLQFCAMLHAEACGVLAEAVAPDDGSEYEYEEVDEAGDAELGEEEDDEGLEQAVAILQIQEDDAFEQGHT